MVHPEAIRLLKNGWTESIWSDRRNFSTRLQTDYIIRQKIEILIGKFNFSRIVIEQIAKRVVVTIHTHKPGSVIGKKGEGIEKIRKILSDLLKTTIEVNVQETANFSTDPRLICAFIAEKIENRMDYRRAVKFALKSAIRGRAEGCLIIVSGRLGGATISRTEKYRAGKVPLQSNCYKIKMQTFQAQTTYGVCGIKTYVSFGRVGSQDRPRYFERGGFGERNHRQY